MSGKARFISRFAIVVVSLLLLEMLSSCTTSADEDGSNGYFNVYLRRKEKFPEYASDYISSNLIEAELLSTDVLAVPVFSDANPGTYDWTDGLVSHVINNELQVYTDGRIVRYFHFEGRTLGWRDLDLQSGTISYGESAKSFDGTDEAYSKISDKTESMEKVDFRYLAREMGADGTAVLEAIGTDVPVYVWQDHYLTGVDVNTEGKTVKTAKGEVKGTISRRGVGLRAWIVLAESHQRLEECLSPDALYPDGYHYATGYGKDGFDRSGYDAEGYGRHGFNRQGVDREGNVFNGRLTSTGMSGFGTLTWTDGEVYRGWFSNNEINGLGILYGGDGSWYAGQFDYGTKVGRGVLSSGGTQVLQEWTDGSAAVLSRDVGDIVDLAGDWIFFGSGSRNGRAHGTGDAYSPGSGWFVTDGEFVDGRLASGSLSASDGTIYRGRFSGGLLVDGEILSSNGSVYKGQLSGGKPNGTGFIMNVDGTRYEGDFADGTYEGEGVLTLSNGDVFEGSFQNGLPHGMGIYKNNSEDTVERCEYYDGKRIDQVFLIRLERAKEEAEELAEAERRRLEEEERQRQAEARRRAAEEAQREAERNQVGNALLSFGAGFLGSKAMGLDTASSLQLATALTQDVVGNTGGTNLQALQSSLESNQYQMQMDQMESKYGKSDLTEVDNYVPPSQPKNPEPAAPIEQNTGAGASRNTAGTSSNESRTTTPEVRDRESQEIETVVFHAVVDTGDYPGLGMGSQEDAVSMARSKARNELYEKVHTAGFHIKDDIGYAEGAIYTGANDGTHDEWWYCKTDASATAIRRIY